MLILLLLIIVMFAAAFGVLWMLQRYGADAVAGRQEIAWPKGKYWRW